MNQCKLDMVKQEMARLNTDVLGISEIKWMGISEFNSDDHYIYYCGQESLWRNGVVRILNKESEMQYLGGNFKNDRMVSIRFQGKSFNISVIKIYAPTTDAQEPEVDQSCEDPQDLLALTPKKMSFSS